MTKQNIKRPLVCLLVLNSYEFMQCLPIKRAKLKKHGNIHKRTSNRLSFGKKGLPIHHPSKSAYLESEREHPIYVSTSNPSLLT